jgi:hypothetical protein
MILILRAPIYRSCTITVLLAHPLLLTPTSALNFLRGSSAQADATNLPANLKDMAFTALINHKNCQMVFC